MRPLQEFHVKSLTVTPIALSHDALNTTGYIFDNGSEKLVYVTDTGYVNQRYYPLMNNADYIIMESNHDVEMLMHTHRPQFLKQRICSDQGHLCNEDCAAVLCDIVGRNTKMIVLAHLSQEANTRQRALYISSRMLLEEKKSVLNRNLIAAAAGQYEMIRKGKTYEEVDAGSVYRFIGLESDSDD